MHSQLAYSNAVVKATWLQQAKKQRKQRITAPSLQDDQEARPRLVGRMTDWAQPRTRRRRPDSLRLRLGTQLSGDGMPARLPSVSSYGRSTRRGPESS